MAQVLDNEYVEEVKENYGKLKKEVWKETMVDSFQAAVDPLMLPMKVLTSMSKQPEQY